MRIGSIHALALRLTRLDAAGAPLVGPASMLTTHTLTRWNYTPGYSEGEEIEQKNGAGDLCLYYKAADTLKNVEGSLEVCQVDPELEELIQGGLVLVDGTTDPVGYAAPLVGVDPNPNGVSVEIWTRAIIDGAPAPTLPYIRWVFPRFKFRGDEREAANAAMLPGFSGTGTQNAGWGDGPLNDWTYTSNRLWQWARVATLPPETDGLVAVAAPI